jgi:hypothetical protein
MAAFDFTSNFNAALPGPMNQAAVNAAWTDPAIQATSLGDQGSRFSIMAGAGKDGVSKCQRAILPAGQFGGDSNWYNLVLGNPGLPVNLEWDHYFEPGFDFSEGVGKIGPSIYWGPLTGSLCGSVHTYIWNSGPPGQGARAKFSPLSQVNRSGYNPHEMLGSIVSPNWLVGGQWYHMRVQVFGGPTGWAKYWVDGLLIATSPMPTFSLPTDLVTVGFNTFAGGGSSAYAPLVDSYERYDNAHIYTSPIQVSITQATLTLS